MAPWQRYDEYYAPLLFSGSEVVTLPEAEITPKADAQTDDNTCLRNNDHHESDEDKLARRVDELVISRGLPYKKAIEYAMRY